MDFLMFMMAQPGGEGGGSAMSLLVPFLGMMAIFYFLLIRPQQKRQKESKQMLGALKKGDRVVTSSGLYGTIHGIKDDIVVLKIADDVKVEMLKSSVSGVTTKDSS